MRAPLRGSSLRQQLFFWSAALVVFIIFLTLFSSVLLPFIAGMVLAYFLDPVAGWLERRGLSRLMASIVILISFVLIFSLALIIIIPLIVAQASEFIAKIPSYVSSLQTLIASADSGILPKWVQAQIATVKDNFSNLVTEGAGFIGTLLTQIWNSGKSLIDVVSLLVVTPVVAFYLLLDWDRMIRTVDSWVPRDNIETVRQLARDMDKSIAGFIRGQGSLCIILGLYYAIGLTLVGLNFGLLIGFFAGLISFIPYVGSIVGLVLAVGVALVHSWPEYTLILMVLGVFFSGQFIEGNILQPKLVGSSVGLHPVWLMFALFAFGALFGFVGLLVAVPAAAAMGVLVRFALSRYLESDLYHGRSTELPWDHASQQSSTEKNGSQG